MSNVLRYLAYAAAMVAAFVANVPDTVKWLVLIMGLDVATGVALAIRDGNLSSAEAWKGGMKKAGTLIVIGLVMVIDRGLNLVPGLNLASAVTVYYIWTEALSVVTNASLLGVPIPDILKKALAELNPDKFPAPVPPVVIAAPAGDLPPIVEPPAQDPRTMRGN